MGQKSKEYREKKENIIYLKVGRSNKMTTGGSPSARHLLIASPQLLTLPTFYSMLCTTQTRRDHDFCLKQITLARSFPKMAEILPPIM
jgi:hypothetical protein